MFKVECSTFLQKTLFKKIIENRIDTNNAPGEYLGKSDST